MNFIRSTYPVISTGVTREFRGLEGQFRGGTAMPDTLDGQVGVARIDKTDQIKYIVFLDCFLCVKKTNFIGGCCYAGVQGRGSRPGSLQ